MDIQRWIARREPDWRTLNRLLKQSETQGIRSLTSREVQQMASLYRSVSADLARAQTHSISQVLLQDLQSLASRGFAQIYQGSRRQEWHSALTFIQSGWPALVRQTWAYTAVATAVFWIAYLIAWWFAWQDPSFLPTLVPTELISQVRDDGELWMGSIVGIEPLASSRIMTNNLSVSFGAVGGGMIFGIYTLFLMFFNGLHIGAIAALVSQNNLAYPFWAFVFPHGSLELPAIFLAGGAGLLIGRGILFPGSYRRSASIRYYGSLAAQLLFGIVPMLVIAGIIEGFFSPSPAIPDLLKYVTGILIFSGLVAYINQRSLIR